jgi:hypothetical protein
MQRHREVTHLYPTLLYLHIFQLTKNAKIVANSITCGARAKFITFVLFANLDFLVIKLCSREWQLDQALLVALSHFCSSMRLKTVSLAGE